MSFDPTSIISLIQNCKTLYDYFSDVKHSSAERRRLLDEVRCLEPELEALHKVATTPGVAGDRASMDRLGQLLDPSRPFAKVVDETLDRIKDVLTYGTSDPKATRFKVLGRRGAAALWWTVDKAEVKDLLSDLERYKSRIGLAIQHDMFKQQNVMDAKLDVLDGKQDFMDGKLHIIDRYQAVIGGKLDDVEVNLSNKDRLKIAKFISKNDYTSDGKQLLEKKLLGTGMWMICHATFIAWRDTESANRTLWCYGHPGAGKSFMAALIVEHLQSTPGNIVLSVFCRYSSKIFTTPYAVLGGMLRQLIEKTFKVPRTICELYWSKTDPSPDSLTGFLDEIAASHRRPIYVVVDALDECPFGSDLLRVLQHLHSLFRVLITSRPVFTEIKEYPSIKIRASDHDILVAVDATLPKLKGGWLDDALKSTIRAKIVEKADGMFLLASLQLRELERDVTCQRDVIAILDSLPRTLDAAYELTFQRIREQGERTNELVCRALALVILPSPCRRIEIVQHLLAEGDNSQYPDIDTILHCCHGLVRRRTNFHDHLDFIRV
ncbi:hypothetical protein CPB85DRAFT_1442613 [Mucidula mucida]|nr:hypothetical protein CPB85DRAFT_1442613 [Mucidula mucida]